MSDPLRTDTSRALDAASGVDRDAKIEQLLLAGLDQYFAGQYEQAINVWTRVLFLDRSHARARAYIERARNALAERQRRSEQLLHDGVAAFQRGETAEARRLLSAAIDGGAPSDEALAVLGRLNRLDHAAGPALSASPMPVRAVRPAPAPRRGRRSTALAAVLVLIVVGVIGTASAGWSDWLPWAARDQTRARPAAVAPPEEPLPLPTPSALALERARDLAAGGRLHDALTALALIRPTDPEDAEANRLRADVQRQLLALVGGAPTGGAAPRDRGGRR